MIDSYFLKSNDIKNFQKNIETVDSLLVEFKSYQNELRESSNLIYKLQATNATKNELLELKERITNMEPSIYDKLPDYIATTKLMQQQTITMENKLKNLETNYTSTSNEVQNVLTRLNTAESTLLQCNGKNMLTSEEVKVLNGKVISLESSNKSEFSGFKDLLGSLSRFIIYIYIYIVYFYCCYFVCL
jgi:chromosome segregation ATPase